MCPFWNKSNYAHEENELKYTKLIELKNSGLVDNNKNCRIDPCLSWVGTGACLFGQTCHSVQDPSICNSTSSWIPHKDILPLLTLMNITILVLFLQQVQSPVVCCTLHHNLPHLFNYVLPKITIAVSPSN